MPPTLSPPLLSRLSAFVATQTGLHFPQERWGDLERGITAAAPAFGMADAQACAHLLLSSPPTQHQIQILASHLTVGETYFFRERKSFEALETQIFPELIHAREHADRRLRIWSAGCCTGEEPYSIAILLDRLLPSHQKWNLTILATDINPAFLRKAADGVYGDWSFRDTPAWVREHYFRRGKNARCELKPAIRQRVAFSYLNLVDDVYPLIPNKQAMDVIFCRNVLMYFSAERAQRVVENLYRSLADGGWLIVSPAETSNSLFSRFTPVQFPGVVLYRKAVEAEPKAVVAGFPATLLFPPPENLEPLQPAITPAPVFAPAADSIPLDTGPLETHRPAQPDAALPTPQDADREQPSRFARSCANQGRLDEAAQWCGKAIATDKLNPAHHYLLATIQQELGENEAAAQSLTRALYLDPEFVLAHFALGNLRLAQGRCPEAARHFDNALALLRTQPPDETLPESEGMSAARLGEIVEAVRLTIPRASNGP